MKFYATELAGHSVSNPVCKRDVCGCTCLILGPKDAVHVARRKQVCGKDSLPTSD